MPRRIFSRLLFQHLLVLGAVLLAGGAAIDEFVTRTALAQLGSQLERLALAVQVEAGERPRDLQEVVRRLGAATKVRFTVVGASGAVLADSAHAPATMENHAGRAEIAQALAGGFGRALRKSGTLGIEFLYVAVPGTPVVRAAVPVSETAALSRQIRNRVALSALPAALVALALAFWLSRSLTGRIREMIRFAAEIARGSYGQELRVQGDDELADLERSLAELRDQIRDRVDALDRDRETLSALLEGLPHAVLLFGESRRLSLANGPARRLLRLPEDTIAGLPLGEVLRNPKLLEELEAAPLRAEPFRLAWLDPPGEFEVSLRLLPDGEARLLVVLRDVTREAHLERVRSDFVVNLSHELRTPLTAIRGAAETLLDAGVPEAAVAEKFLDSIRRNANRLEALLRDVSDLGRAEAGTSPPARQDFDLGAAARAVLELFAVEAQKAGVALAQTGPEALAVTSDPEIVESVLVNLVQNAVRYTPPGGRVEVSLVQEDGGSAIEVRDTGIGIPARDLPRVTERFYRVDPGRSRAVGGTGLGLSIVKHLVELLGGALTIESEPGRGTRVRVFLPDRPG